MFAQRIHDCKGKVCILQTMLPCESAYVCRIKLLGCAFADQNADHFDGLRVYLWRNAAQEFISARAIRITPQIAWIYPQSFS